MDRLLPYLEAHLIKDVAKLTIDYLLHSPLTPYEIGFYGIEEMIPALLADSYNDYKMCIIGAAESNSSRRIIDIGLTHLQCTHFVLIGACRGDNEKLIEEMLLMDTHPYYGLEGACYGGHWHLINKFVKLTNRYTYGLVGACIAGRKDIATYMIELGASPKDAINRTLENKEMSKWLMDEYKVKPTSIGEMVRHGYMKYDTPVLDNDAINAAFVYNQTDAAIKLIGMGAYIDGTCIDYAFRFRSTKLIKLLPSSEERYRIELKWACRHNNISRVMELVAVLRGSGDIIMTEACNTNNITLAKIALDYGPISTEIIISHAGLHNSVELLRLIPEKLVKNNSNEIFKLACLIDNRPVIDFLLDRGTDPNAGWYEIYNLNNLDLLRHVLSRAVNPVTAFNWPANIHDIYWMTYHEEMLNYLFDEGLNPDYFCTIFSSNEYRGHAVLFIDLAIKRGANVDMALYGNYIYGNYIKRRHIYGDYIKKPYIYDLEHLLDKGADPYCILDNQKLVKENRKLLVKYGVSPQHIALPQAVPNCDNYEQLIEMGVHPDTLLYTAVKSNNLEMAEYLLEKGASPRLFKAFAPLLGIALKHGIVSPNYAMYVASTKVEDDSSYQHIINEALTRGAIYELL